MSNIQESNLGVSPREDVNKNASIDELAGEFKNTMEDMDHYIDKLSDEVKTSKPIKHDADSPREGAETAMTSTIDDNIRAERQLQKSNELLNEVRPLLEIYPKKFEELKKLIHTIKIRHLADMSKQKRRYKEEMDRRVDEAKEQERESMKKEMEDLKNEAEKNKTKWINTTSKLKAESMRLERANDRISKAESETHGNKIGLTRSIELLKKEIQQNHRDLVSLEKERRKERARADKEAERARKLENKLDTFTRGKLHHRTITAEEKVNDVEHRYEILHWKFRSLVSVVNDLVRQGTPPCFTNVYSLQDFLDSGSDGRSSQLPEIPEPFRTKDTERSRPRRRRLKSPKPVKLPEIAGAEKTRKNTDSNSGGETDENNGESVIAEQSPKSPELNSPNESFRPGSRISAENSEDTPKEQPEETIRPNTSDDNSGKTEADDQNEPTESQVFLTETNSVAGERNKSDDSDDGNTQEEKRNSRKNTSKENLTKNKSASEDDMEKEEYEKELAALKRKRTLKKKK
ncbi:uncharacterized protein LOC102805819 [Saccoglossus kowalevskii]|uniref:Myb-like protein X-like n=1 Tax=Saccoglossus kowalevskii TaxID=10224 RepID=A0ABM0LVT3_SACKO|nr:PREDICTED: myb-like protein X-like [Saccoglossus kowalevskii]